MATRQRAATKPDTVTDPVEWARHYWDEQELEGNEQYFLAMSSLLRFQRLVVDAVETQLRTHKLNLTDYLILMTLQLSEAGTRLISNLARSLMIHATTATLATDRLEERRLIKRAPHPTDRRATCVTITAAGRRLVNKATAGLNGIDFGFTGAKESHVRDLLATLTDLRAAAGDA